MYRVKEDHESLLEIQKSKFICYLHKCYSENEAKDYIQTIRKLHPNANHHCYAFVIGEHNEIQRSNDDGEPSGTAGLPMLECLNQNHMQDIVAITVRYFGGIKLGGGGLIRAYSKSVAQTLQTALITEKQERLKYMLSFSYDLVGKLDYYFRQNNIEILDKQYHEDVNYTFLTASSVDNDISELTNGKYLPEFLEKVQIEIPITTSNR